MNALYTAIGTIVVGIFGIWFRSWLQRKKASDVATTPTPNRSLSDMFDASVYDETDPSIRPD